jgi:hypothetical protein
MTGVAMGVLWAAINTCVNWWTRSADPGPKFISTDTLLGLRSTLAAVLTILPLSVRNTLLFFFLLFVLRVVLRNQWLAAAVFALIFAVLTSLGNKELALSLVVEFVVWGLTALTVLRWGLLALAVAYFTDLLLLNVPVTTHTGAWYFGNTVFMLAIVVALAGWGLWTSLGERRVMRY